MLGSVGDLVEDVVVRLREQVNVASDTQATVIRRRGGSAANVIAAACRAGVPARFIGQVGDDATGRGLTEALLADGADVVVRRAGRTGTIIVLVDTAGERTMLSDRAACTELTDPDPAWLDGLHTLHIPYYSLAVEPLAAASATLAQWAVARGIRVSIDTSSAAVLQHVGPAHISPTPVGGKVTAEANLEKVEGRRLIFHVSARDERGLIAAGKVTRVLVDVERFLDKAR